ncbi:hypothetical protein [Citrobacter pasteurii]|nr:hypothetical protein [Citrobacter pasteurii]
MIFNNHQPHQSELGTLSSTAVKKTMKNTNKKNIYENK